MTYLFVSHASEDKRNPIFRRVVERLLDMQIALWIDKPGRISTDPRLEACGRIPYGGTWSEAITTAIEKDECVVLFFWSNGAAMRMNDRSHLAAGSLLWELSAGFQAKRLFIVRLDETGFDELPAQYRSLHACDLRDYPVGDQDQNVHHAEFLKLVEDLRAMFGQIERSRAARTHTTAQRVMSPVRTVEEAPLDPFWAYMVDRTEDSVVFRKVVEELKYRPAGPRPLFLLGPKREAPDKFLERCWRLAKEVWSEKPFAPTFVEWPTSGNFREKYVERLNEKLLGRVEMSSKDLVERLRADRQPQAYYSYLSVNDWNDEQRRNIVMWLDLWRGLNDSAGGGLRAVPILCVLTQENTGWGSSPARNTAVMRAVSGLATQGTTDGRQALSRLPAQARMLLPFRRIDTASWIAEFRANNIAAYSKRERRLDAAFDALFRTRTLYWPRWRTDEVPVSMKEFVDAISPILADSGPLASEVT